jgi:hypothetical protein
MTPPFPLHDRHGFPVPTGVEAAGRVLVSPGLNQVVIPAGQHEALDEAIGVLQFPLGVAGQLQRTGTGLAHRVLKRDAERVLARLVRDEAAPAVVGRRLARLDRACTRLQAQFAPVARTCLRVLLRRLLDDDAHRAWYAETYARNNDAVDADKVAAALSALETAVQQGGPSERVARALTEVTEDYGLRAADAVVDVALTPPAFGRLDRDTSPDQVVSALEDLNLTARVETVANALAALPEAPATLPLPALREALQRALAESAESSGRSSVARSDGVDSLYATREHPDHDASTAPPLEETADAIGAVSGRAWLFTAAFERAGIAAVVAAQSHDTTGWTTNPRLDLVETDAGRSGTAAWQWAFVTDRAVAQLAARAHDIDTLEQSPTCPLCALATDVCGAGHCAFAPLYIRLADDLDVLVRAFRR